MNSVSMVYRYEIIQCHIPSGHRQLWPYTIFFSFISKLSRLLKKDRFTVHFSLHKQYCCLLSWHKLYLPEHLERNVAQF